MTLVFYVNYYWLIVSLRKKISLGITILVMSSKEFVKTVKSLEDSSALIIDVTKTIEN